MGKKSKRRAASAAGSDRLFVGGRVTLQGLKAAKYNGMCGVVQSGPHKADGRYGVLLDGSDVPLAILAKNIETSQSAPSVASKQRMTTQQQLEERERVSSHLRAAKGSSVNADQLRAHRTFFGLFETEEIQIQIYGRKITPMPNFLTELLEDKAGLPIGLNVRWARQYLHNSFEHASALPHQFELAFKQDDWVPQTRYFMRRLGTNDPQKLQWYTSSAPGSIFGQRSARPYTSLLRHSFSNQAYRKEVLHRGKTHVAVGFVDLGMLFAANLQESSEDPDEPLRFIGIEMSAYSVAKAHVIWEMLVHTPPPSSPQWAPHLRRIVQVWYSSTWGEGTFETVNDALVTLCGSHSTAYHPDVRELLEHWLQAPPLPLREARDHIERATTDNFSEIGNLTRKLDRIALAKYELTRDFALKDPPLGGNILMFDCPDGTPPLATDETVFSAMHWADVLETLTMADGSGMHILQAVEKYALGNVAKLAEWASLGHVEVELIYSSIQDVVPEVVASKPWTMSWSNVLDYMNYDEFHRLARACSANGDTIHYAYSMNWSIEVSGTSIVDFAGKERAALRKQLIESTNQSVEAVHKALGWDRYLRSPPPTNPINTVSQYGLNHLHFRTWVDYFFAKAELEGPVSVGNREHSIGSPLSTTGGSSVALTWTYDPEVRFNNLEGTWSNDL